ncbi:MAG: S4 domain-containing protein, partial [Verrucomicrobiota bacterium]
MNVRSVEESDARKRLDVWLHQAFPDYSRARWQQLIKGGDVKVNGETTKPNHKLREGDEVDYVIPDPAEVVLIPQDIPLDILFEDEYLIVVNKPAGLVVHPAVGHDSGTLVNALLYHCDD